MRKSPRTANERSARGRAPIVALLVLALAAAGAWWYFAPHSLPDFVQRHVPASPTANPPLYKWRDAKGGVHVTDTPPTDRPYETLHFDPNANVLPKGVAPSK